MITPQPGRSAGAVRRAARGSELGLSSGGICKAIGAAHGIAWWRKAPYVARMALAVRGAMVLGRLDNQRWGGSGLGAAVGCQPPRLERGPRSTL
jgi:hypothetical protein